MTWFTATLLALFCWSPLLAEAQAQQDPAFVVDFSGIADLSLYAPQSPSSALLYSDDSLLVAPRLILFANGAWRDDWLVHTQLRVDRGFDPLAQSKGHLRLDEYFIDIPLANQALSIRLGKSATGFGRWVTRHLPHDNPMISAPLVYEDVLTISDRGIPASLSHFVSRRNTADLQGDWVPVIWGPSYATGIVLSTQLKDLHLLFEVKNSALSSRPAAWDAFTKGFDTDPTFTAHAAWQLGYEWQLGASMSRGPYLLASAESSVPAGVRLDDVLQTTLGFDLSFEYRNLQLWSEAIYSAFEVPHRNSAQGEFSLWALFIEAKFKIDAQWWLSTRVNSSWFDESPRWERDSQRFDIGLGYRANEHNELRLECNIGRSEGNEPNGNRLCAAQWQFRW